MRSWRQSVRDMRQFLLQMRVCKQGGSVQSLHVWWGREQYKNIMATASVGCQLRVHALQPVEMQGAWQSHLGNTTQLPRPILCRWLQQVPEDSVHSNRHEHKRFQFTLADIRVSASVSLPAMALISLPLTLPNALPTCSRCRWGCDQPSYFQANSNN